jgi:hypothetical protein
MMSKRTVIGFASSGNRNFRAIPASNCVYCGTVPILASPLRKPLP